MERLKRLYETNTDFKRYVDRYSEEWNLTVEETLQQSIVMCVATYYEEK